MRDFTLPLVLTLVLTLLAGVVVALTRLRLRNTHPSRTLRLHSFLGALGFLLWSVFCLASGDAEWASIVGVLGLGCWWVVAIAGLLLLARWKPTGGGKRAASVSTSADNWSSTPWLSLVAHVGVFGATIWLTLAYVTSRI